MTQMNLDLRSFGFQRDIAVHGAVEATWSGGKRLVFLFAENHRDREMKRLYVVNSCKLVDGGVVSCAGTEIPMTELDERTAEYIEARSRELFEEHKTDAAVIDHLNRVQPWWYGVFQFGSTLKVLRPSLPVCCVEDRALRDQMKPISDAYILADLEAAPHPSPEYPNMCDHPLNLEREQAMIDHLLTFWDSTAPTLAAILNTGLAHWQRIAGRLQERGINYIYISIPGNRPLF
jgi:hypothetical protein